jgi:hypothetical protein
VVFNPKYQTAVQALLEELQEPVSCGSVFCRHVRVGKNVYTGDLVAGSTSRKRCLV